MIKKFNNSKSFILPKNIEEIELLICEPGRPKLIGIIRFKNKEDINTDYIDKLTIEGINEYGCKSYFDICGIKYISVAEHKIFTFEAEYVRSWYI